MLYAHVGTEHAQGGAGEWIPDDRAYSERVSRCADMAKFAFAAPPCFCQAHLLTVVQAPHLQHLQLRQLVDQAGQLLHCGSVKCYWLTTLMLWVIWPLHSWPYFQTCQVGLSGIVICVGCQLGEQQAQVCICHAGVMKGQQPQGSVLQEHLHLQQLLCNGARQCMALDSIC